MIGVGTPEDIARINHSYTGQYLAPMLGLAEQVGADWALEQNNETEVWCMEPGQIIRPQTLVINISPLGFHRYALQFFDAAKSIILTESFSPVPYYLYCHSLELALKAYLLAKNIPIKDLKTTPLGHDLMNLLRTASDLGLDEIVPVSEIHRDEVRKANDYYDVRQKGFEYFRVTRLISQYQSLPNLGILEEFTFTVINEIEEMCLNAPDIEIDAN